MKKNKITNLLIFPCGSLSGIEIFNSFKYEKNVCTHLANSSNLNNKLYYKKKIYNLPSILNKKFIPNINNLIKKYKISFLYPSTDIVAHFLKKNQKNILCQILTHDLKTLDICNDKVKTYNFFNLKKINFIPKIINKKNIKFPIFIKKKVSHSGIDAYKINNNSEYINFFLFNNKDDYIVTEYLPGREFTIDCFSRDKKLLFKMVRLRKRILGGISVNNETIVNNNYLTSKINIIAKKINKLLTFKGAWFFQVKLNDCNEPKLMEIVARPSGNSDFSRVLNVNLPLLTLYLFLKKKIIINKISDCIKSNVKILKPYFDFKYSFSRIYIDFDDCIYLNKKLNEEVMENLFRFKIKKKKIILITKHRNNIYKSLDQLKLVNFFDKIVHIKKYEKKYKFIKKNTSIFVDDSFSERLEVSSRVGIPVFSPQSFTYLS